jgi:hypothetical protein
MAARQQFERCTDAENHRSAGPPEILVVNVGVHYKPDKTLVEGLNGTIQVLRKWQKDCRDRGRKCLLFWRTTIPGHPACGSFSVPENNVSLMENTVANVEWYNATNMLHYHWYDLKQQNQLVEDLLESYSDLKMMYLNAYDLFILRPDLHIKGRKPDCLHYCLPGVPDAGNQLLLQEMLRSADKELMQSFLRNNSY